MSANEKQTWSKEPWFVAPLPWDDSGTSVYGDNGDSHDPQTGRLVADFGATERVGEWLVCEPDPTIEDQHNADRAVACVNALAGVVNPARFVAISEEMLAVLSQLLDTAELNTDCMTDHARGLAAEGHAVIAKIRGET